MIANDTPADQLLERPKQHLTINRLHDKRTGKDWLGRGSIEIQLHHILHFRSFKRPPNTSAVGAPPMVRASFLPSN